MELFWRWFVVWWSISFMVGVTICWYIKKHRWWRVLWWLIVLGIVWVSALYLYLPSISRSMDFLERAENPEISDIFPWIDLYISPWSEVHNASAHGFWILKRSIVYTQRTYDEVPLSWLLWVTAHEVGHMVHWHLVVKLVVILASLVGTVYGLQFLYHRKTSLFLQWVYLLVASIFFLLLYCGISRLTEGQADQYAIDQGYWAGLVEYFEIASEWSQKSKYDTYPERLFRLHYPLEERVMLQEW